LHNRRSASKSTYWPWVLVMLVACMTAAVVSILPARGEEDEGSCYFLVARDDMPDPTFQQTVILMVPSLPRNPIVAGVIVNKPTEVTLAQLFTHVSGLKHPAEKVYFGGPVSDDQPLVFVRGTHASKGTTRLMENLYAGASVQTMADILSSSWSPQDTRFFLGRAQWTRDQLRGEILRGAWDAMPAKVDLIFERDPVAVWRQLQKSSHLRQVDFESADGFLDRSLSWCCLSPCYDA
jgi:putative transcriptional regulator